MAPECVVCDDEAPVSDACPHCGAACCPDHRSPEAHDCPGTDAGETTGWRIDLDGVATGTSADTTPDAGPLSSLFRPGIGLAGLTLLVVVTGLGVVALAGPLEGGDRPVGRRDPSRRPERRGPRAAGVGTTTHDAALAAVARAHSRDMRERDFVDHTNPDGQGPQDRADAAGVDCRVGENIYQTPRGSLADSERALADYVVRSWLDSPGHRETLRREQYTGQGVGVAIGADAVYVTQMFC